MHVWVRTLQDVVKGGPQVSQLFLYRFKCIRAYIADFSVLVIAV